MPRADHELRFARQQPALADRTLFPGAAPEIDVALALEHVAVALHLRSRVWSSAFTPIPGLVIDRRGMPERFLADREPNLDP